MKDLTNKINNPIDYKFTTDFSINYYNYFQFDKNFKFLGTNLFTVLNTIGDIVYTISVHTGKM